MVYGSFYTLYGGTCIMKKKKEFFLQLPVSVELGDSFCLFVCLFVCFPLS
jgi:hypothetical protein